MLSGGRTVTIPAQEVELLAQLRTLSSKVSKPVELLINARIGETVAFRDYCSAMGVNVKESASARLIDQAIASVGFVEAFKQTEVGELAFMIEDKTRLKRGVDKNPAIVKGEDSSAERSAAAAPAPVQA